MRSHLQDILARPRLTTLLQPVLDLQEGRITGYAATPRAPSSSPLHAPHAIVRAAAQHDLLAELDFACMQIAIKTFVRLHLSGRLFLNVSPTSLLEARFHPDAISSALDDGGLSHSDLVIVIRRPESSPGVDFRALDQAVSSLQAAGIEVAIDDFDAAFSRRARWGDMKPFFVRADTDFVAGLQHAPRVPQGGRALRSRLKSTRPPMLAQGVENGRELRALKDIGIRYAQGDLIGHPSPVPIRLLPAEIENCLDAPRYH